VSGEVYRRRAQPQGYGFSVGILLLDAREPYLPGDPSNASTYEFPVLFEVVEGATVERVTTGDEDVAEALVAGARKLEAHGVGAISSNCGFMLLYQDRLAASVDVPVAASSLLQIPLAQRVVGPRRRLGIITAFAERLTEDVLRLAGATDSGRIAVADMARRPAFAELLAEDDELVRERMARDVVAAAEELRAAHPDLGAILIECSPLATYGPDVQQATGLPVFDFVTLIEHVEAAAHRRVRGSARYF
jgi:Asp/Glu/hydantoin racemase